MSKLITRKTSDYFRSVSLDALTPASEPSCEIEEDVVKDYTVYDSIVDSLNLTDNMRIALECRQNGLSYPEIAATLERAQSTVFGYFIKMRQRPYTANPKTSTTIFLSTQRKTQNPSLFRKVF